MGTCARRSWWGVAGVSLLWLARTAIGAAAPAFGPAELSLCGQAAPAPSASVCGFTLIARDSGPQVALMGPPRGIVASVRQGEVIAIAVPVQGLTGPFTITAKAAALGPDGVEVGLSVSGETESRAVLLEGTTQLELSSVADGTGLTVRMDVRASFGDAAVRWSELRLNASGRSCDIRIAPAPAKRGKGPPPVLPTLRPPIEQALIEWDWRMQDGIDTVGVPTAYPNAIQRTLDRGGDLIRDLIATGVQLGHAVARWEGLRREWKTLSSAKSTARSQWEDLWRRVHALRRRIALGNPLADVGPLGFIKQVPGAFSHQLTQYYGRYARPGGGVFVLDEPGRSMRCRQLADGALAAGSYQHLDVSYEGDRMLFAFCKADTAPKDSKKGHHGRYYHLYEMAADGSNLRQLTDGPFDDFAPRYLPNGRIVFVSTRRLGWHRCGTPGCENYTLATANGDGSDPRPISYHETQEWDPAVLDDGRVVYTRWDYVDRHAVYYEQLWAVRPDGSLPAAYYGNNTFNPVGIWEARQVPGADCVMATAGAHHAMTAGSIILVDVARGVDGSEPITRLTPDAPFPESESRVAPRGWYAPAGIVKPPPVPPEAKRWPGHCYRTPHPLSETYFLAAYSFDALIGEPSANPANMFGIYLVDRFGNKELLYRDLNIASLWPAPLRPRRRPPVIASDPKPTPPKTGTFFLQNVYDSQPPLPAGTVKRLRIVQVLPKSTPGANRPTVGLPNASPGKQVLGTVPVDADGSAYFRAPARIPLSFQALDDRGQAVQVMRSLTYLQPGENAGCVGCHEPRTITPTQRTIARALSRPPSTITPGPDGSRPLSYPILVQPVLDRHCVKCHNKDKPDGGVVLTGGPQRRYTVSYNALAPRVSYAAWGGRKGDFRKINSEPISTPGHFGAKGSSLMKLLLEGHQKVALNAEEMDRLVTWMDANALFYGTFDPADQARQQRGGRIKGPKLQ